MIAAKRKDNSWFLCDSRIAKSMGSQDFGSPAALEVLPPFGATRSRRFPWSHGQQQTPAIDRPCVKWKVF